MLQIVVLSTRIHSSRMRNARPFTVVPVCMLGMVVLSGGGGGGAVQGEGVVVLSRGGGGGRWLTSDPMWPCDLSHDAFGITPPLLFSDRMTDACENITFARFSTRSVIRLKLRVLCQQMQPTYLAIFMFWQTLSDIHQWNVVQTRRI